MSFSDQQWCPSSLQVTVLQARGLRIKGKSGTNDAYAVMQVGKEKFQTSVAEKSVAPVWKEEAAFDLPPMLHQGAGGGGTLHVQVLHRALVGPDKLLGQAVINLLHLSEDKTRKKTEWFKLLDKTGKPDKDRGEVLVDIQFLRNNMTASMFDLSAAGKSRSRLGKLKDKVRGKKKESDATSNVVPSFTQVLTDSEEEGHGEGEVSAGKDEKKKKLKMKSLFSPKSNLQKNMSQSMSVLPVKNSSLSSSQSSGLNAESSEGKKKFKFMIHKRSGSSDSKDSSSAHQKHAPAEQSNVCINGSHIYCEEPLPRTSRIGSNYSLASSGHGSMEDVPDSSPPSVDSLRAVRQYSPWTEEEEEEEEATAERNTNEEEGELRKKEEETIKMEEKRRIKQEEERLEKLAEEKRRQEEEEKRTEYEKIKREEEERIRREEEEDRVRREEELLRLADEKRRREEETKRIEEEKVKEEEERVRREEEVRQRQQQEERVKREEEERERLAEEMRRLYEEERRKIEEEERRKREEEERIRLEEEMAQEEERARRQEEERKLEMKRLEEEERRRIEEEKVRKEEEERIRLEEERVQEERRREKEEMIRQEEKRKLEEQEIRQREKKERINKEEEEKSRKEKEEYERLVNEKMKLEEEERKRFELQEKRRMEEEERTKLEKEHKKLEEQRKLEEQERKRIEEEEKRQREEEERIRMEEEERRKEEEERARKEKEEYERLVKAKMRQEEEQNRRIEEEERARKEEQEKVRIEEERRKEQEERFVLQCQSSTSTNEKDLIGSQQEKRAAPQPPGRPQADRQTQKEQDRTGMRHLAQINKQSKDKDAKTTSLIPKRSEKKIAPVRSSATRTNDSLSSTQYGTTTGTTDVAKTGKRLAPLRPGSVESELKQSLSCDGNISQTKQEPVVNSLNPFEDDEDENELTSQNDTTGNSGSVQWPPPVTHAADGDTASQMKIKSSKIVRAPQLPATKAPSTLIDQSTEGVLVTDDTGRKVPDIAEAHDSNSETKSAVYVKETALQDSQHETVQSAAEESVGKKEAPPAARRRLQPVKPLNALEQQSVSVANTEEENKATVMICEVQEKTKVNDTALKGPYSQLTRQELISMVLKQQNQLSERDHKISELEQYIDNLLVRVMEEAPTVLMSMNSLKKAV
ncbi:uncharacterized protein LKV04_015148 [Tautogolabrus adspersus]